MKFQTPREPRLALAALTLVTVAALSGCQKAAPPAPAMQAMPVMTASVSNSDVPLGETYVSTVKGRRSATMAPQVDGNITKIFVKSGDFVKAGQLLMTIDPLKQQATVEQSRGTEFQTKAQADYATLEEKRQKALYEAGVTSRDTYDQAIQNLGNTSGAYNAAKQGTATQQQQLAYYQIRAPFAGVVGDIPVHVGDYVTPVSVPSTLLTTIDDPTNLEAYIYIPTERSGDIKRGMDVDILGTDGSVLTHTKIDFVSPQVDNGLQSILAKAPVPPSLHIRTGQIVNAHVVYTTKQLPTVPVLAVTRVGGQTFVYIAAPKGDGYMAHQVAVNLGEVQGNAYPVLSGLHVGDKVILSGIQFLQEGAPVKPLSPPPAAPTN